MRSVTALAACAALLCVPFGSASAQTAPPAAAPSASPAPDVVRLKNGGLLRGTIAELEPGKQVTIVLVTGDRRTVSMDEVQYAGAASEAPKPADAAAPPAAPAPSTATDNAVRPLVTVRAAEARLQLRAAEPDTTFYVRTAVAGGTHGSIYAYDRICTAPCEASMPAGSYEMALSQRGGAVRGAPAPVAFQGESTLQGSFESRMGLRMLGLGIAIAGGAGGIYLMSSATSTHQSCTSYGTASGSTATSCYDLPETDATQAIIGSTVAIASVTTGVLMMIFIKDKAIISVSPGAPASGAATPRKDVASGLAGLRVQGAF
jgi:hypothetical protein